MVENVALIYYTSENPSDAFPRKISDANRLHCRIYCAVSPTEWRRIECQEWTLTGEDARSETNEAVTLAKNNDVSRIYTIHAKSMFLRTYRWHLLRCCINSAEVGSVFGFIMGKTADLCELYHYPAVLTLEERSSFSMKDIQGFFELRKDTCYGEDINKQLMRRFCMKFH